MVFISDINLGAWICLRDLCFSCLCQFGVQSGSSEKVVVCVCIYVCLCSPLLLYLSSSPPSLFSLFLQDVENCWVPKGLLMQMSQIQLKGKNSINSRNELLRHSSVFLSSHICHILNSKTPGMLNDHTAVIFCGFYLVLPSNKKGTRLSFLVIT